MHHSGAPRREIVEAYSDLTSLRGAKRRSNPFSPSLWLWMLRGACHRARIRATRWLATTPSRRATLSTVVARLDRAIQYSRGVSDRIEKPRRTGYPACAGYDGGLGGAETTSIPVSADLHYRRLTPAARPMQMRSSKARRAAGARPKRIQAKRVPVRVKKTRQKKTLDVREVSRISLEGRSVIVAMCVGQLGSLLPHVVVPSILAAFLIPEWHLSGAQAGLLAGSGAAGYMLTVPVLATLTDRIDARKILIAGSALSALGTFLFGMFASGLWSGALFNAVAGVGFAGAYMPGLKALTDRLAPGDSSRAITLYTSSFSFGVGLSFLVSQLVAESFEWRAAFFVTALGPMVMLLVCFLLRPIEPKPAQGRLLDFAPVFRNTQAMGFILGYGAHCFELYGIRTWLVASWTFVAMRNSDSWILTPVVVSVLFSLLAMPASIIGNELAIKFGRHRAISAVMFSSAVVALLIGLFAAKSSWFLLPLIVIYAITVPADSGALTSGMTMAANPSYRGATMATHSTVGFSLSALGAWAVGVALDAAGGPLSPSAWMAAFSVLAAGILLGPVALYWSRKTMAQP
jgi:predicted MFS family arabinose efflux permease